MCFTHFGVVWIYWKQKQEVVVFLTKRSDPAPTRFSVRTTQNYKHFFDVAPNGVRGPERGLKQKQLVEKRVKRKAVKITAK